MEPKNELGLLSLEVKTHVLEKIKVRIGWMLPKSFFETASFQEVEDRLSANAIHYLTSFLAGSKEETQHKEIEVLETRKFPRTWWDYVKERFAPKWFLKKWAVNYEVINVRLEKVDVTRITNIYPGIEVPRSDGVTFDLHEFKSRVTDFCGFPKPFEVKP